MQDPTENLTEVELDTLWSVYEGHSLLIERPQKADAAPNVNVILSVDYEDDTAVAEVEEIPEEVALALIAKGYLERSLGGPVLDEDSWFDEELQCEVMAEEYVLSELGTAAIDATSDEGFAAAVDASLEGDEPYEADDEDVDEDVDEDADLDADEDVEDGGPTGGPRGGA